MYKISAATLGVFRKSSKISLLCSSLHSPSIHASWPRAILARRPWTYRMAAATLQLASWQDADVDWVMTLAWEGFVFQRGLFRDGRLAAITQLWGNWVAGCHILIVDPETAVGARSWSTWIRCGPRLLLAACFSSFFWKGYHAWSVLLAWCSQYWCGGW